MRDVTDEQLNRVLSSAKPYTLVVLRSGPAVATPDRQSIIWEHGRRNTALMAAGTMPLVFPVMDESPLEGICVFATDPAEAASLMHEDPAVRAGPFSIEVHPCLGFPGTLP